MRLDISNRNIVCHVQQLLPLLTAPLDYGRLLGSKKESALPEAALKSVQCPHRIVSRAGHHADVVHPSEVPEALRGHLAIDDVQVKAPEEAARIKVLRNTVAIGAPQ